MPQSGECVICLTPVINQSTLSCCQQTCHAICVAQWKKIRHTISCPNCRQVLPFTVIEVTYPQLWKKGTDFVQEVKEVWKDNRFLYGICHDDHGSRDGFWGELHDPYEPDHKTLYYLRYTKSQVIPRMKTSLSFL